MSRAALMSSGGNVFEALFAYQLFRERWYDEVDAFYINFNNHTKISNNVFSEFCGQVTYDPKVHLITHPDGIGNGPPIKEMLLCCREDQVMLLEDDGFIFTPGVVATHFDYLDRFDLVGSPRYTHGEVAEAAKKAYNLDYSGHGDKGFGWWPNFFYINRTDLLKTDLDFGSKQYTKGEYFKELDHTFSETCYTDTFTWASLQLRHMGLTSYDIAQFHADPYESEQKKAGEGNWRQGEPSYIHAGSLSAGWGGYLSGQVPEIQSETNMREIETRCAFWSIVCEQVYGFDDFKIKYRSGIAKLIKDANLSQGRIIDKINVYQELMGV